MNTIRSSILAAILLAATMSVTAAHEDHEQNIASKPKIEKDRPTSIYEDLGEIGFEFSLTPGTGIEDGVSKINTALDYTRQEDGVWVNRPRLLISLGCPNTLYSLENWMNVDGQKGACKAKFTPDTLDSG